MKITVTPTERKERTSLLQKMRLASASRKRGAEVAIEMSKRDVTALERLGRKTWGPWAGGELTGLAGEIEKAQPDKVGGAKATLARAIDSDDELVAVKRRARVFEELVRFSISEMRLRETAKGSVLTLREAEEADIAAK